jgi:transcriptional regulator with XRE-family HTH domain
MQVSRLENGLVRPDIAELFKILEKLEVSDERQDRIVKIARQGPNTDGGTSTATPWDLANASTPTSSTGPPPFASTSRRGMPGVFQTPEFMEALIELTKAEGALDFTPRRWWKAG